MKTTVCMSTKYVTGNSSYLCPLKRAVSCSEHLLAADDNVAEYGE